MRYRDTIPWLMILALIMVIAGCNSDDPCVDTIEPQKVVDFRVSYESPATPVGTDLTVEFTSRKIYCEGDLKGYFEYTMGCSDHLIAFSCEWPATLTYKFNNALDKVNITCIVTDNSGTEIFNASVDYTYNMVSDNGDVTVIFIQ